MLHQRTKFFGDVEQMLAQAYYDAGQTDTEIGLAVGVSVNNIIHWRREQGLPEHCPPVEEIGWSANGELYSPRREPATKVQPTPRLDCPGATPLKSPGHPVQPTTVISDSEPATPRDNDLELGTGIGGKKVFVDLEELLTTRLLVQGSSGSGKSHLLRKLLEEATGIIQQVVIDPEGDFVSLDTFGHTVIEADKHTARMRSIAENVRRHRGSVVLNLEALEPEQQMQAVADFLNGLFDVGQEHWHAALVVVDEAQLFAPGAGGEEDGAVRKASLAAMTNLMCRGRKRGLAGVIATQRIAKVHKNVVAEACNFLVGRTFMDIDMNRAADLMGLPGREAGQFRDLNRGEFMGLGPAISRRPAKVKVGDVITAGKAGARGLTPLPAVTAEEMQGLLLPQDEEEAPAVPALRVVR